MRILLLSSVEHQSGSALRFRGLAGALQRRGHEVHLLEPVPPDTEPETPPGVRRHPCPRLPAAPEWQAPLWMFHGLAAVQRCRPDVVWALKALPNAWIPAWVAGKRGARVAVDFDDLDHGYYGPGPARWILERCFRWAARAADDRTTHNEAMAQSLRDQVPEPAPVPVGQGVDVERFAAAVPDPGLRERLALGRGTVLLYAGHLGAASDLGALIPALSTWARGNEDARLLVVGDGRDRGRLEAMARAHLPAGFPVFTGTVAHRDMPRYFGVADVALNFLEDTEANRHRASIKIREALAAGVPVVASPTPDARGLAEFLRLADLDGGAVAVGLRVLQEVQGDVRHAEVARQETEAEVEVVVVDDGSTDRTAEIAEHAGVRVVRQENRGPAAARNRGWREARAPVVLFTDSDCAPRPDWVERMRAALRDAPVAGGSYGIANPGPLLAETVHAEIRWRHRRMKSEIEFAGSYNLGIRREVLEEVGGFDESYADPSAEDNDLSYRIRDAGHSIRFVREALVDHHHPVALGKYLREQARHGFWRVVLYAKHPRRVRGDGYAGPFDFAAVLAAVFSVVCAPLAVVSWRAAVAALLSFTFVLLVHHLLALRVARETRTPAAMALAGIGTLRAYARGWGLVRGVLAVVTGRTP